MHRFVIVAGVVTAACSSGGGAARPAPATDDVVTAPLRDPAAEELPAREPPVDPEAPPVVVPVGRPDITLTAAGRFAAVRTVDDQAFVDVYEIAAGASTKIATTEIPSPRMFEHDLVWADPAAPIVFHGRLVEPDGAELFGTITGDHFAAVKPKGKGDVLDLLTSAAGEVWIERCAKWDPDNPDEEGCNVRKWYRLTPKAGTASKRPQRRVLPADAVPAPAAPRLEARADGSDFVLACTDGSTSEVLLAGDQVYEAPTWRWLSADPPIALVSIAYAGMGGGDPMVDDHSSRLLRGCDLDDSDPPLVLGPAGLWALQVDDPDGGGTSHDWRVMWRGVQIAQVPGEALAFAGGR